MLSQLIFLRWKSWKTHEARFVENPTLVTPQDRPLAMMAWEIGKDGHCFRREIPSIKKGINKGIMKGIGGFY